MSQNSKLINGILKDEMGFQGLVRGIALFSESMLMTSRSCQIGMLT